jgi:uncharacterized membrane protein
MALAMMSWIIAIPLLGIVTGLRSMTPMAVLCWFAYLGHLPVEGTWAFWTAKPISVAIFTLLAAGEYVGDKLPRMPNRTSLFPLITRLVFGGFIGAVVAVGLDGPGFEGGFLGVAGALVGAFGGYQIRRELVHGKGYKDWHVAAVEDAIALGCAIMAMGIITG